MSLNNDLYTLNIDEFSDQKKLFIKQLCEIPSKEYKKTQREKCQKERCYFKHVASVILLVIKSLLTRRKYFHERWLQNVDHHHRDDDSAVERAEHDRDKSRFIQQAYQTKSSIDTDILSALNSLEHERNERRLKKIVWILTKLKAFEKIIAKNMIHELARKVNYQQLENGRILAMEGTYVRRLYFIISGKLVYVKHIGLKNGDLYKLVGSLSVGGNTNPMDIERKRKREYTIYSKGVTELFYVEAADLKILQYFNYHLPVDYLPTLPLFQTYPFDTLLKNHKDSIVYKYYGPNEVISSDSVNSPWIYVIKSGLVKVAKYVKLVDFRKERTKTPTSMGNRAKSCVTRNTSNMDDFSYQDNLIDNDLERSMESFKIDDTVENENDLLIDDHFSLQPTTSSRPAHISAYSNPIKNVKNANIRSNLIKSDYELSKSYFKLKDSHSSQRNQTSLFKSKSATKSSSERRLLMSWKSQKSNDTKIYLDSNNFRFSYVVIDIMGPGEVFGVYNPRNKENLFENFSLIKNSRPDSLDERKKIILISTGTEVLLLNKTNFNKYVDICTLCKIGQIEDPEFKYLNEDTVREHFMKIEEWKFYKKSLVNYLVSNKNQKKY